MSDSICNCYYRVMPIVYIVYLCSLYGVVLVTGMELGRGPAVIVNANNGRLPPPYPGENGVYTAAVYTRAEDVPTVFTAGNNMVTTAPNGREYVNRELSEDTTYGVFYYIRLQSDNGVAVSNNHSNANP